MSFAAHWSTRFRRLAGLLVLTLCTALALVGLGVPSASAATGGLLGIDMVVNTSGTESRAVDIRGGATKLFIIKYSCSASDCDNARITLPLAAHVSLGDATYGADWTQTRSGSVVTWTTDSIPAGTTSQITFNLTAADGVFPEGSMIPHEATISGLGSDSVTSATVTMTVHSGSSTNATVSRVAGGAVGSWTTYRAGGCLVPDPRPGYGLLGVQAGSVLTMTLPSGAVLKESNGATVNGRTLTWTLGAVSSSGCVTRTVKVDYPAAGNAVGDSVVVGVSWAGSMVGGSQIALGADSGTWSLGAQVSGGTDGLDASISTSTPQLGDSVTQRYRTTNATNTVWDSVRVDAGISVGQTPTSVDASTSRLPGTLWIAVDGGPWVRAADVPSESSVSLDPYATTLPSGATGLVEPQTVTAVRFEYGGLQPGDAVTGLSVTSTVRSTTTSGHPVAVGDSFAQPGTFTLDDSASGPTVKDAALSYTVVQPVPTITVRAGGGGNVANGATTPMTYTAFVSNDDLVNPVFSIRLAKAMTYLSWTPDANSSLPVPTMTKVADYPASGQTLLRFTWPRGTVLPRNSNYTVHLSARLGDKSYGTWRSPGFVSSATGSFGCGDPWFLEGPDVHDLDGNGDTTKTLCAWGVDVTPITNVGGQVVQSIKGSWDTGYSAGPATAYSSPGADDSLRTELQNTGNIFLKNAVVVTKLPRPGDDAILSAGSRNPSSSTFPVQLRGAPVVPSLDSPVDTYWTTDTGACLPELSWSPAGCSTPTWTRWSDQAPVHPADVTALKFDFGANRLVPFGSWTVDIPVTTPTSGATEPDYAVANPVGNDPGSDERAVATSAAVATREDISSTLSTIESTPVTLSMPGSDGPYTPLSPANVTSTGAVGQPQTVTLTVPPGGSVHLLDGSTPVASNQLVVPGEGTYVLVPATGAVTFTPAAGFIGRATPVTYQVADRYATTATATYRPRVTAPAAPDPADATSTGTGTAAQSTTFTRPSGGQVRLVDPRTLTPIASNTVTVPGVGSYVLAPATGKVTFTPVPGYAGTPDGVMVAVTDTLAQTGYASYVPTVLAPAAPDLVDLASTGTGQAAQHVVVPLGTGRSVTLVDSDGQVVAGDQVSVPGQGTYTLDRATGRITFGPAAGYAGAATPVGFRVTDAYGQSDTAEYAPVVQAPAAPVTGALTSTGAAGHAQGVSVTVPVGGSLALWDGSAAVSTLTVAGQGTYRVDPATHRIVFTPAAGFTGSAAPVAYQVGDAYGQESRGTYQATVTGGSASGGAEPTTVAGSRGHRLEVRPLAHVEAPAGQTLRADTLRLLRRPSAVGHRALRTTGGSWVLRGDTGRVVFRPARDFVGVSTVYFSVRTSGGRVYRSTMSVVVRGVVTGHRSATVYFAVRSSHLSGHARAVLRQLAAHVPDRATSRAVSVGYVQPERYQANDRRLSTARARHVVQALSRLIDLGRTRISGAGRADQHDWRARRATATVHWRLVQH